MSTLVISWVRFGAGIYENGAENCILETLKRESLTTSATNAQTAAAPSTANAAIVFAVDANHSVNINRDGGSTAATAALGVDVRTGAKEVFGVLGGVTKISAITV